MKSYCLIIILFSIIIGSVGCAGSNIRLQEDQLHGMKPFMEKTVDEDRISIAVPVYKF